MTTTADVLANTRNDYLLTGSREPRNALAADVTASGTTLTFTRDLNSLKDGAKVSIGLEDVYVWDVNTVAKTATVQRGDFGSTQVAHVTGDIALINTRFSDAQILRAVNAELKALSSASNGLYRMASIDVTYSASISGYDLRGATDVISVWQLRYKETGSDKEWPLIARTLWNHQRGFSPSEFSSGHGIFIHGLAQPGNAVRVWYRTGFGELTDLDDDIEDVTGLHPEAHDLLSVGAAIRLTVGREVHRNLDESQGSTRRADEVPAGANLGGTRALMAYRKMRLGEEAQRLANLYPVSVR